MRLPGLFALLLLLLPATAAARGLEFDEQMQGNVYFLGEFRMTSVHFHAVIQDIDAWVADPTVAATLSGTVYWDPLLPQSVTGTLQVLAPAPGDDGRILAYRFANRWLQFTGVKHVHDDIGFDLIDMTDDMTTLHGAMALAGAPPASIDDLLHHGSWTSELHFEWWDAKNVAEFVASFRAIDTPPGQRLQVKLLFLQTVLGDLLPIYYPGLSIGG